MTKPDNILIICREIDSIRRLARIRYNAQHNYVLASDDPRVHEVVKKYSWIREICWIEKMESFYSVAPDVLKYLEIINNWLISLANEKHGFTSELLFWIRQCEGGMTTQRIQDLLLLINSYLYLFDFYNVKKIILVSQNRMPWEDSILIETARSRNIPVNVEGYNRISILLSNIQQYIEIIGRSSYYLFNFLRVNLCKSARDNSNNIQSGKDIVFQLCSSAKKHIDNIVPLMKALKRKGYNPIALCWSVTERYKKNNSSKQIRSKGLKAVELEKYAHLLSAFRALLGVLFTWRLAKSSYRNFISLPYFSYKSVRLAHLLWPSIRSFILTELMPRYIFNKAIKNYLQSHNPIAIKIWNEGVAPEGHFLLKNLSLNNRPLVFYWKWVPLESPYDQHNEHIDLYLAAGEWHKKNYENIGVPDNKIVYSGMSQFDNINDFLNNNTRDQSFIKIGIPKTFAKYIFFDPNSILRGYLSVKEQASTLMILLKFAFTHSSCALLIKPHPSSKEEYINSTIKHNSDVKNIFLFNKNNSVYDILNVCDIVITKFSTLGIEAMFFEKPVISVLLDKEDRWKIYENAVSYFYDLENLYSFLDKIVRDNDFYEEWKTRHLKAQKNFLRSVINYDNLNNNLDPSDISATVIDQYLRKNTSVVNNGSYT